MSHELLTYKFTGHGSRVFTHLYFPDPDVTEEQPHVEVLREQTVDGVTEFRPVEGRGMVVLQPGDELVVGEPTVHAELEPADTLTAEATQAAVAALDGLVDVDELPEADRPVASDPTVNVPASKPTPAPKAPKAPKDPAVAPEPVVPDGDDPPADED